MCVCVCVCVCVCELNVVMIWNVHSAWMHFDEFHTLCSNGACLTDK